MKTWKPSKLAIFLSAIITIAAVAVVSTFGAAMGDNNGYAEYDMYPENGHAEHDSYTGHGASPQYPFSEDGIGASLSHLQVTDEIMIRAFYADDYPGILGLHDSFNDLTVALTRNIAFVTNTTLRNFSWIEIYSDPNNPSRPGYPNQFWVRRIMQNVGDFHPERPFVVTWQPPLSADDRLFTGILFTDDNGMTRYFIFYYGRGAYDDWFGLYEFVPARPYGSDSFLLPTPTPPVLEYIIWYSTSNGHLYEFRLNAAWMRDDAWYFIHRGPLH